LLLPRSETSAVHEIDANAAAVICVVVKNWRS